MMRRRYPQAPVAAVGAVVIDDDPGGERVLLIRRGEEPLKGEWSLPGGAVELGETLEQAVSREVREETGLEVAPVGIVEVLDRIHYDALGLVMYHYVLVDYECRVTGGTLRCASDASDARWVGHANLADIPELATKTIEVILKALKARQ